MGLPCFSLSYHNTKIDAVSFFNFLYLKLLAVSSATMGQFPDSSQTWRHISRMFFIQVTSTITDISHLFFKLNYSFDNLTFSQSNWTICETNASEKLMHKCLHQSIFFIRTTMQTKAPLISLKMMYSNAMSVSNSFLEGCSLKLFSMFGCESKTRHFSIVQMMTKLALSCVRSTNCERSFRIIDILEDKVPSSSKGAGSSLR